MNSASGRQRMEKWAWWGVGCGEGRGKFSVQRLSSGRLVPVRKGEEEWGLKNSAVVLV